MDQSGTNSLSLLPDPNIQFDFSSGFSVNVGGFPIDYTGTAANQYFKYQIKLQNGYLVPAQTPLMAKVSIEIRH